ncbi:YaiO family outer membrane beta-barrel protein [Chryseolinea sp. H1M3-3]|uniref:YaiO family outer membrane beta-barrel protein n=1 Tax=Chryseolinea sp. H1M3-3 TaxID=3034144 RepID=UPI0023EBFADE|nr:YaiO family outer membrane beta-barrel protein [Chryseolinea sp. H1M3-3]
MKSIAFVCFFIYYMMQPLYVHAQDHWKSKSVDEILTLARDEALHGNRENARNMLRYILEKNPDYHDVRILLGRTYAWDGKRAEARKELQVVLSKKDHHEDALSALIDVEMWDDQYAQALALVDLALTSYPNSEEFLFKRARILNNMKKDNDAIIALNQLLVVYPSHEKGLALLKVIKTEQLKYTAGISYNIDAFSRTFDPAHYVSAQLGRSNNWGSSILRLNYASRFETNGFQTEVDLYPKIAKGVYVYLNYGFSSTGLFPEHRGGAEIFSKLPKSLEVSGGARYLYFDTNTKITIYTGSIGWYFKSYWLSVRPYITPDKVTGTSVSTTVSIRKYFATADHYIGLSLGAGFSPDERRFQSGAGLSDDGIYTLKSQRMGLSWNKPFPHNFIFTASTDFQRQELIFDEGNYVLIYSIGMGLKKRF